MLSFQQEIEEWICNSFLKIYFQIIFKVPQAPVASLLTIMTFWIYVYEILNCYMLSYFFINLSK